MKKKQFLIQFLVAIVIATVLIMARGFDIHASRADIYKDLSDGFAAVGLLYLCFGGLSMIATTGFYDIFGYGFKVGAHSLFPSFNQTEMPKDFYDYKVKKMEKRNRKSRWMTFVVGGAVLLIGIFFTILWYQLEG